VTLPTVVAYKHNRMSTTDHGLVAAHPHRNPYAPEQLVTRKRMVRQRPLLIAAAVVLVFGGGIVGAVVALNSSSDVVPAGACPVTGGYYAYAVPQDPAHPPAAGSSAPSWGWTPRKHQIKVGDRMRIDGRMWRVTEIAAMPGVEPVGRPFGIEAWPPIRIHRVNGKAVVVPPKPGNYSLTMCGRLVFQPVR
jgi:hypothetical protein